MNKSLKSPWLWTSLLTVAAYLVLAVNAYARLGADAGFYDGMYLLWAAVTLGLPLVLRKWNYYKIAFLVFVVETVTAVLSPHCYFETAAVFMILVLWIPALVIGAVMSRSLPYRNKAFPMLGAVLFTYLLFPATQELGSVLNNFYLHLIPLCG